MLHRGTDGINLNQLASLSVSNRLGSHSFTAMYHILPSQIVTLKSLKSQIGRRERQKIGFLLNLFFEINPEGFTLKSKCSIKKSACIHLKQK